MPRDYRHKQTAAGKQTYQRKSQAKSAAMYTGRPLLPMFMAGVFLVGLVLAIGLFISQQFAADSANQASVAEVKPAEPVRQTVPVAPAKDDSVAENNSDTVVETSEADVSQESSALKAAQDFLGSLGRSTEQTEADEAVMVSALDTQAQAAKPAAPEPVYSFYQGLGEVEVLVDAEPLPVQLEKVHYIQAGSFGSKEIAIKEQQRLAKHGVMVKLNEYQGTKRIYYRLVSGPYHNRLELNKQRNILRRLGASTLVFKQSN
ncbi:SPOR domain-containing protein [Thiomicrorhabdus sediminis]|uniref:SPOR domain-containing protein n=1 Tax=Thiomicrorhabdus sediminis TaxID=2580412 RepID=A0A4P9K3C4_9GAMM|nr:SPOR domain-containing protein [Thiomicrorhabdus sediminis]QCU89325.1 hypothetical protein FE785_01095 [Thiomicrorhabdus sediminis]